MNMKPIISKNLSLLNKITQSLFVLTLDKRLDPMDEWMPSASEMTLNVFSFISKSMPKKKFYPICMKSVDNYMKSNDPLK